MPLHPVPIIIGTTLAVIGSGYAFKKFIYDPHLAPYIEAFLAQHHLVPGFQSESASVPSSSSAPIAVPASSGHSSARQNHNTNYDYSDSLAHPSHLRRRRHAPHSNPNSNSNSYELEDSLLHSRRLSHGDDDGEESYGSDSKKAQPLRASSRRSSLDQPLIQVDDRPETPQDEEIRQVIFNYAPTPSQRSGDSTPATHPASNNNPVNPFLSPHDPLPSTNTVEDTLHAPVPSTTFSFLSLSQQSSPEDTYRALESLSFAEAAGRLDDENPHMAGGEAGEDDVLSIPESNSESFSEYQDAEIYSPISSRARTPAQPSPITRPVPLDNPVAQELGPELPEIREVRDSHETHESQQSHGSHESDLAETMGLTYVVTPTTAGQGSAGSAGSAGGGRGRGRGPMSVVSMSESELGDEWRSESDWEAVGSDVGR